MLTTTQEHNLSNVDLENRTATCSVCGDTRIFVEYSPIRHNLRVGCIEGRKADSRKRDAQYRAEKQLPNPGWEPQHRLRDVDLVTMTGICSVCGPTEVLRWRRRSVFYLCMKKLTADARARYGDDYVYKPATPQPAFLPRTKRENIKLIDTHKVTHGCKRCGYHADPLELEIHFKDLPESELTLSKLALFPRKRLSHLLRRCEVYCIRCHPLVHGEAASMDAGEPGLFSNKT